MMFFRRVDSLVLCLLSLWVTLPLAAQEARWLELNRRVAQLSQEGKQEEAILLATEAVRVAEATYGPENWQTSTSLNDLAVLYKKQGRYGEAEPLYRRALAIREKVLGPMHFAVAISLNNLAELFRAQHRFGEAEPLHKRALAIRERVLGPENLDVAYSLNNLGILYHELGRYGEAEPLYQRALSIREKALGQENVEVAYVMENLAELYYDQGRDGEAEPLYKQALSIREKVMGREDAEVATFLENLAALYYKQGLYREGEPLLKRALVIRERLLHPDDPALALSLYNLGSLYQDYGRYEEAESLYKRALAIREKVLRPDDPAVAESLNNLASLYYAQGWYGKAEPRYKRALAIQEKVLGPENHDVAASLNNLALLYYAQGKYAEAEPLYLRALQIDKKALGPEHPSLATTLNNLALLYYKQDRYREAEPLYKRALAIQEKVLGPQHPAVARSLNNLALLYEKERRYGEAEPLYKQALAIREKVLRPEHPLVPLTLNNLALLYYKQGRYREAEPLYNRALAIQEKVLGSQHPDVANLRSNLAMLNYAQGNYAEADPFFQSALENLRSQFEHQFTYMSEKDRLSFLDTSANNFPVYFSFCFTYRSKDPALAGRMYDAWLLEKGLVVNSIAAIRAKIAASGDRDGLALFERITALRTQLASVRNPPPNHLEQWRETVQQLQQESNDLESSLVQRLGTLAEEKQLARATWRDVQKALKPGEAAVEFVHFPYHDGRQWTDKSYYAALIVTPETATVPAFVPLGEAGQLEGEPLNDFRSRTAKLPKEGAGILFYQAFWKPLEPYLAGHAHIYVSPDGVLNEVSFAVVPTEDGRLLMDKCDIDLVLSTKDLLREFHPTRENSAVLVGNPRFDLDAAQHKAQIEKLQSTETPPIQLPADLVPGSITRGARRSDCPDLPPGGVLCPLKGTAIEMANVFSQLKQANWDVKPPYTQERALKEVVKRVRHPRLLHVATHGFFSPDQRRKMGDFGADLPTGLEDPMLRSGLMFAGADRVLKGGSYASDMDDGVLTAYEATGVDLQGTELVVLSACETGLGEIKNGEGVFGLRRALQEAGAESVLMSMWKVPDDETRELMTLFYENWLSGKDRHEALHEAQREMRNRMKARWEGEDRPFYWGAFVLVGL